MQNTSISVQPPKLLDQVVAKLRVKHYSLRTEKTISIGFGAIFRIMASDIQRIWVQMKLSRF
jgi:hypothetical protein